MATRTQQTENHRLLFYFVFLVFLWLLGRCSYLFVSNIYKEKEIDSLKDKIQKKQVELDKFSDNPWFDKLQYVQNLEENNLMMPWSDHVNAIMKIFAELLAVDKSDTSNISFSNFEISLESIRLDGHVNNLRILYQWSRSEETNKPGLIAEFEELDLLDNISIRTYEKTEWELWYDFTLTANVINNGK